MLRAQCMISKSNVNSVACDSVFVVILFKTMYNKTFGAANNSYLHLDYPDINKTSSNNCLLLAGLVTVNV